MRTKDVWRRRHRVLGAAVLAAVAIAVAGCAPADPEPTPTPTPSFIAQQHTGTFHPEVPDGNWLDSGYANGIQDPISIEGELCTISPDRSVVVTARLRAIPPTPQGNARLDLVGTNLKTGQDIWEVQGASCSEVDPRTGDIYDTDLVIRRFDPRTGAVLTTYDPGFVHEGKPQYALLNTLADDIVIFSGGLPGGGLAAFDVISGELLWTAEGTEEDMGWCTAWQIEGAPVSCRIDDEVGLRDARTGTAIPLDLPFRDNFQVFRDGIIVWRDTGVLEIYELDGTLRETRDDVDYRLVPASVPTRPLGATFLVEDALGGGMRPSVVNADGQPALFAKQPDIKDGLPILPNAITRDAQTGVFFPNEWELTADPPHSPTTIESIDGRVLASIDVSDLNYEKYAVSAGVIVVSGLHGDDEAKTTRIYLPAK